MKTKLSMIMVLLMITGFLTFSSSLLASDSNYKITSKKIYTAYNMWYEADKEDAMWTINYKTGIIIPVGTEVTKVKVKKSEISFVTVEDNHRYTVHHNPKFHPGKTTDDYADMMFTGKDFFQITQGMSNTDISGIEEGIILAGMTKAAVIVAYGYPPQHKTPDLYGNIWTYWMNRFKSIKIYFDNEGKTINPPESESNF